MSRLLLMAWLLPLGLAPSGTVRRTGWLLALAVFVVLAELMPV